MTKPKRVRMTRSEPWRHLHPDAVIVDRRNKTFCNPFPMLEDTQAERRRVVDLFERWYPQSELRVSLARYELRGKDLACWCPLDQPCHADVLLRLANDERFRA